MIKRFILCLFFSCAIQAHADTLEDRKYSEPLKLRCNALGSEIIPEDHHRFVILGEARHRLQEVHCFATALFQNLVENHGFRVLALESSWRIQNAFHAFERQGEDAFSHPDNIFYANAFLSPELKELFIYLADFNRRYPHDRVIVTGIQPESPYADLRTLVEVLGSNSPTIKNLLDSCQIPQGIPSEFSFIRHFQTQRNALGHYLTPDQYLKCQESLDQIDQDIARLNRNTISLQLSLTGLRTTLLTIQHSLDQPNKNSETLIKRVYEEVDQARMAVFTALQQRDFPHKKVMLWMHNWHAAPFSEEITGGPGMPPLGTVSIGHLLWHKFGPQILRVGTATYDRSFDYSSLGHNFVEPAINVLTPGSPFLLKTTLHQSFLNQYQAMAADFDGSVASTANLGKQFDVVGFFPTTTPLSAAQTHPSHSLSFENLNVIDNLGLTDPVRLQAYFEQIAKPKPWLGHLFSFMALQKTSSAAFYTDFRGTFSPLVPTKNGLLSWTMSPSIKGEFYPNPNLFIRNQQIDSHHSIVYLRPNPKTPFEDTLTQLNNFQQSVQHQGLADRYLIANPFYETEKLIAKLWAQGQTHKPVLKSINLEDWKQERNAVLLFPDHVHGDVGHFQRLMTMLADLRPEWLAIEMFFQAQQSSINTYLDADPLTSEWEAARTTLSQHSWAVYPGARDQNPSANPWLTLLDLCRRLNIRVYGIEPDGMYSLWGHGETPFGAAVRNYLWVEALPKKGRGILFGGSAHFTLSRPVNVQDLLPTLRPGMGWTLLK